MKPKRLITHADCPDGIASAMIVKHAHPGIEVVFAKYGTDHYRTLTPQPGDLFVDIAPHEDTVEAHLKNGTVVLDHHKSRRATIERFEQHGLGAYADETDDPGVCGAVLAYREVWKKEVDMFPSLAERVRDFANLAERVRDFANLAGRVRDFANLAGIRDTWQRDSPQWNEACAQATALTFFGADHLLNPDTYGRPFLAPDEMRIGRLLRNKHLNAAAKAADNAYRVGHWLVANESRLTSDMAEHLRAIKSDAKALACFRHTTDEGKPIVIWSLRSIADGFDVSEIAKRNGGGGHTRAAGFTVRGSMDWPSIYAWL